MKTHVKRKRMTLLIFFLVAALLIFTKSKLDERNFAGLDNSFSEMYNDRLVVESYIYRLNDLVSKKKIALIKAKVNNYTPGLQSFPEINSEIEQLITAYALTRLTTAEKIHFQSLRALIHKTRVAETSALEPDATLTADELFSLYDQASRQLSALSDIQVAQGRSLAAQSHSTVASSLLAIRLEWALYVFMLVILLALYKKRDITSPQWPMHLLN